MITERLKKPDNLCTGIRVGNIYDEGYKNRKNNWVVSPEGRKIGCLHHHYIAIVGTTAPTNVSDTRELKKRSALRNIEIVHIYVLEEQPLCSIIKEKTVTQIFLKYHTSRIPVATIPRRKRETKNSHLNRIYKTLGVVPGGRKTLSDFKPPKRTRNSRSRSGVHHKAGGLPIGEYIKSRDAALRAKKEAAAVGGHSAG